MFLQPAESRSNFLLWLHCRKHARDQVVEGQLNMPVFFANSLKILIPMITLPESQRSSNLSKFMWHPLGIAFALQKSTHNSYQGYQN